MLADVIQDSIYICQNLAKKYSSVKSGDKNIYHRLTGENAKIAPPDEFNKVKQMKQEGATPEDIFTVEQVFNKTTEYIKYRKEINLYINELVYTAQELGATVEFSDESGIYLKIAFYFLLRNHSRA